MEYNHKDIESRWQAQWKADKTYHAEIDPSKPKFYVLDMFPSPSGAGLPSSMPYRQASTPRRQPTRTSPVTADSSTT